MRRISILSLMVVLLVGMLAPAAFAQSGHFLTGGNNQPVCRDIGTQLQCTAKVAGLGGTTFELVITASGTAVVECYNPGGNRAPGQDTSVNVAGSSGELSTPRNGQFTFRNETTDDPGPLPARPTCPNNQWTPVIVDVIFTSPATLTLYEDGQISDQITVPVT